MELKDVEMSLGIQFPDLFHAISRSGMMDHLIHSREWVEDKSANDRNYARQEDFSANGWAIAGCTRLKSFRAPMRSCMSV